MTPPRDIYQKKQPCPHCGAVISFTGHHMERCATATEWERAFYRRRRSWPKDRGI